MRWRPAPARWLAVWRPMQFSNFHCLVSQVCDLPYIPGDTCIVCYIPGYTRVWYPWYVTSHRPYIPGDTCIVRYIPGYTRVWYPWYVTPHTYQVTRVPRLHTYSWCVSGVLYRGFARVGYLGNGIQSYMFMKKDMVLYPRVPTCLVWYAGEATCEMLLTTAAGDQLGKYSKHAAGARS